MESYLARGNPLTIDDESMWKYPFHTHPELYKRYGSLARNIVFDKVYGLDFDDVIQNFPNIRELTLKNLPIVYFERSGPWPITTLRLINFIDIENFLGCALCYEAIETLVLERCRLRWFESVPGLLSLSLIDQEHSLNVLKHCWNLTELTLDRWPGDEITQMHQLERLKIRHSVDPKHREAVEAMNLEFVDIHYFHVPTEDTPILRLDEYCLLHIISFLPVDDWSSFRATHRNFRGLKISELVVDKDMLLRHPMAKHIKFFAQIGSLVLRLVVDNIQCEDVCRLLPLFVNLQELTLKMANIGEGGVIDCIPNGLRKLHLTTEKALNMSDLFHRLAATLQDLELNFEKESTNSTIPLSMLGNIRKFKCVNLPGTEDFLSFLMLNSGHMRDLDVCLSEPFELNTEMWRVIAKIYPLENLRISTPKSKFTVPEIPQGSLPNLKSLSLTCDNPVWKYVAALEGSELQTLSIDSWYGSDYEEDLSRFPKLKILKLFAFATEALPLIKALPEIKELRLMPYNEEETIRDVARYLKENHRTLLFELHDGILIYTNAK